MPSFGLANGVPDLGAAIGALIDKVDLRQAPLRLDVSNIHRQQSDAAWTDDRCHLDLVMLDIAMLDIGWHDASPSQQNGANFNPAPT
jgi:hypothetical protein